jgi:hypothetical protein
MAGYWSGFVNGDTSRIDNNYNLARLADARSKLDEYNARRPLRDQQALSELQLLPVQTQAEMLKNQNYIDTLPQQNTLASLLNQAKTVEANDTLVNGPIDAKLKRMLIGSEIAKNMGANDPSAKPVYDPANGVWQVPPSAKNPNGVSIQPTGMGVNKRTPEYAAGLKDLAKDSANEQSLSKLEEDYNRWGELNAKVDTGPITGRRPISFNPDYQELQRIQNSLAMNNFKPGQGSMSNMERGLIKQSGPNTIYNPETNKAIIQVQLGGIQNMKDKNAYREWYLEKNGKMLGADRAWNDYIEKNPRFIKDPATGEIVENPQRQDWATAFGVGAEQQGAAPAGWSAQRIQ